MSAKKSTPSTTTQKKSPAENPPAKPASPPKPAPQKSATAKSEPKLSAIDAAAKVLAESPKPLTVKQMIEQMAAKGYWKSPKGKTPSATLYSAIIREIKNKGKQSRFKKTDRGLFAATDAK